MGVANEVRAGEAAMLVLYLQQRNLPASHACLTNGSTETDAHVQARTDAHAHAGRRLPDNDRDADGARETDSDTDTDTVNNDRQTHDR